MRDKAEFDLRNTVITAPAGGIVTKHDLQPGEYVRAGAPIFSVVSWKDIWIEANLKETELTHVYDGQTATIRSEEHTSELQSLMRISYDVFCLKKKNNSPKHLSVTNLSAAGISRKIKRI